MAPSPTTPTTCLETEESTEPPPSTRCRASQSRQPCLLPRLARRSSRACMPTPAARCIAKTSKSAPASSVCRESRREAGEARTQALRAPEVRRGGRPTALKPTRMGGTATSGCSMTSASLMLSRRDMGRYLAGTIEVGETNNARYLTAQSTNTAVSRVLGRDSDCHNQYNRLPHDLSFALTADVPCLL